MPGQKRPPTIFIVDDDPPTRDYLRWLIESAGWHAQVFGSGSEMLDGLENGRPSCLLVDVRLPGLSGFGVQAELRRREAIVPLVMMTAYAEVPMAVRALKDGAADFIVKPFDGEELLERLRELVDTHERNVHARREQSQIALRLARLTPRQREVLAALTSGKPSKVIAAEMGVSLRTVDVHRARIMQTLEASSLPDLFRRVMLCQRSLR